MSDVDLDVLDLARDLSGLPDPATFYATAPSRLARLIPADHVFWTRTDFLGGSALVRGDAEDPQLPEVLGRHGPTHPAIQTYVADPADLTPRRLSDVTDQRTWHESAVYREAFTAYGAAYQLSMVCSVQLPGTGTGWTLTRTGSDFTDRDVELARRLLPVLLVLDRLFATGGAEATGPNTRVCLSRREQQVLRALAAGRTAAAIGRGLGITERTVRKHLAALYEKLDAHDRLAAVARAHDLGLL